MDPSQINGTGQFRCLTPSEIGECVVWCRKAAGWKQLTLAIEARLNERTVQRLEQGVNVDDDSLRKIARAFHLKEDVFLAPRYIWTEDELKYRSWKVTCTIQAHRGEQALRHQGLRGNPRKRRLHRVGSGDVGRYGRPGCHVHGLAY